MLGIIKLRQIPRQLFPLRLCQVLLVPLNLTKQIGDGRAGVRKCRRESARKPILSVATLKEGIDRMSDGHFLSITRREPDEDNGGDDNGADHDGRTTP